MFSVSPADTSLGACIMQCVLPAGVEFYSSGFDSNDVSTYPHSYPIVWTGKLFTRCNEIQMEWFIAIMLSIFQPSFIWFYHLRQDAQIKFNNAYITCTHFFLFLHPIKVKSSSFTMRKDDLKKLWPSAFIMRKSCVI